MSDTANEMNTNALEAMKLTRKFFVVELNFSEDSINELEALFDDVDFTLDGGKSKENIDTLTRVWGSYLGETIRRNLGGDWVDSTGESGFPGLQTKDQTIFPHDAVHRRLEAGAQESVWTLYEGLRNACR